MEKSLHNIADLSDSTRATVEGLVGHPLRPDDVLYIATLGVQSESTPAEKQAAWDELESILAETQRSAQASGLSPDEIDKLIDEESAAVRYGRGT
jgi:hypothetical protein